MTHEFKWLFHYLKSKYIRNTAEEECSMQAEMKRRDWKHVISKSIEFVITSVQSNYIPWNEKGNIALEFSTVEVRKCAMPS